MFDRYPLQKVIQSQVGGGTPSRQIRSNWNGDIPWASVKDFSDDSAELSATQETISVKGLRNSASHLIAANTPLVCTRMAVGRAALAPMPVAINQDVKALLPRTDIAPEYLLALMRYARPQAEARAIGSTVLGISISDYLGIEVPLAPSREQPKISEVLTLVDSAILHSRELVEKLENVKQGLMHDLLTRGIDTDGKLRGCFHETPNAYKNSPLGLIPNSWKIRSLGDSAMSLIDGPFGSNLKSEHYTTEGVRVVRLQNIQRGAYDDSQRAFISAKYAKSLERNRVEAGDVLIASLGDNNYPVGRACCYPMDLQHAINKADCFRFRGKSDVLNSFIMLFMNGERARVQVRRYEQGVTMKRINLGNLRQILVSLPDEREQDGIVARIRSIDVETQTITAEIQKMLMQKSGLTEDLLTGRVRVTSLLDK